MPDFIHSDDLDDTPILAPAEDIPADALPAEEDTAEITTPDAMESAAPMPDAPLTADRALDIAFGAALLLTDAVIAGAKKLGEQTEFIQNNSPAVLAALEEKGKPVREATMTKLREAVGFTFTTDTTDINGDDVETSEDSDLPETSAEADVSQELPRSDMAANGIVPAGGGSAEAEISALERRVRELEQEVSKPLMLDTPTAAPVEDAPVASAPATPFDLTGSDSETPAESGTYDFAPDAPDALADSDYAMSETPEAAGIEINEIEINEMESSDERTPGEMAITEAAEENNAA